MAAVPTVDPDVILGSTHIERFEVEYQEAAKDTWQVIAYVPHAKATTGEYGYVMARDLNLTSARFKLAELSRLL